MFTKDVLSCTEDIHQAFLRGAGKWKGCDWSGCFGSLHINPEGLRSGQAHLAARATTGWESSEWEDLACWLEEVERDAREAERRARAALDLFTGGHVREALMHIQQACALEARYPRKRVWQPLHDAIMTALMHHEEDGRASQPSANGDGN
jgi:hypothetical protein